jgi:hypothetical protein
MLAVLLGVTWAYRAGPPLPFFALAFALFGVALTAPRRGAASRS